MVGADGIDKFYSLVSIIQLPRLNLVDDPPLVMGGELGRMAIFDVFLVR